MPTHNFRDAGLNTLLNVAALILLNAMQAASAAQYDYGLSASALYSNNLNRTPVNQDKEWVDVFRGLFSLSENSDVLKANLYSQLEYRHYNSRIFDDQFIFGLASSATWSISPRRFSITAEDLYTQAPIDPTVVPTPGNRQNINVFSIGPNFTFRLDPVDRFDVGARATDYYYQRVNTGSNRYSGYNRLIHGLSPLTEISLNYEPTKVDYRDNILNQDYLRHDLYAGLLTRPFGTELSLAAGRTLIQRDATPDLKSDLQRLLWSRQLNSSSRFSLSASKQISDSGRDALIVNPASDVPAPVPTNPAEFVGGGIYKGRLADALYFHRRDYGDNYFHLFWRNLDYETITPLDQKVRGGDFQLGYDYSAAVSGAVFANYAKTEYLVVPRTDTDNGGGVRMIYRFRRNLSLIFESRWNQRDSTLFSQNFDEIRTILTIAYNSNPSAYVTNPFITSNYPLYR